MLWVSRAQGRDFRLHFGCTLAVLQMFCRFWRESLELSAGTRAVDLKFYSVVALQVSGALIPEVADRAGRIRLGRLGPE